MAVNVNSSIQEMLDAINNLAISPLEKDGRLSVRQALNSIGITVLDADGDGDSTYQELTDAINKATYKPGKTFNGFHDIRVEAGVKISTSIPGSNSYGTFANDFNDNYALFIPGNAQTIPFALIDLETGVLTGPLSIAQPDVAMLLPDNTLIYRQDDWVYSVPPPYTKAAWSITISGISGGVNNFKGYNRGRSRNYVKSLNKVLVNNSGTSYQRVYAVDPITGTYTTFLSNVQFWNLVVDNKNGWFYGLTNKTIYKYDLSGNLLWSASFGNGIATTTGYTSIYPDENTGDLYGLYGSSSGGGVYMTKLDKNGVAKITDLVVSTTNITNFLIFEITDNFLILDMLNGASTYLSKEDGSFIGNALSVPYTINSSVPTPPINGLTPSKDKWVVMGSTSYPGVNVYQNKVTLL